MFHAKNNLSHLLMSASKACEWLHLMAASRVTDWWSWRCVCHSTMPAYKLSTNYWEAACAMLLCGFQSLRLAILPVQQCWNLSKNYLKLKTGFCTERDTLVQFATDPITKALLSYRKCLSEYMKATGGHFEHLLQLTSVNNYGVCSFLIAVSWGDCDDVKTAICYD